jgi:hypothetical protein
MRTGFKPHSVIAINIPNTQASGDWSGISTPITTLNSGVYYFTYNISYIPVGAGPISNTFTAITTVPHWPIVVTAGTIWGVQLANAKYTKYYNQISIISTR